MLRLISVVASKLDFALPTRNRSPRLEHALYSQSKEANSFENDEGPVTHAISTHQANARWPFSGDPTVMLPRGIWKATWDLMRTDGLNPGCLTPRPTLSQAALWWGTESKTAQHRSQCQSRAHTGHSQCRCNRWHTLAQWPQKDMTCLAAAEAN